MSRPLLFSYDTVGDHLKQLTKGSTGVTSSWIGNTTGRSGTVVTPNQIERTTYYSGGGGSVSFWKNYAYDADGAQTERTTVGFSGTQLLERMEWSSWRGLNTAYEREDPNVPIGMPSLEWRWEYRYNAMGEREQKREVLTPEGDDVGAEGYEWTYYLLSGNRKQLSVWKGLQTSDATFCSMPGGGGSYVHLYPGEYLTYGGGNASITQKLDNTREYRIGDHLGTNRVVVDNSGTVLSTADYEPFGKPLSGSTEDRLSWIDKERDAENGYGNFGVRAYDYDLGRFTSIDPLWEKYRFWSPYHYSMNGPIRLLDPTGMVVDTDALTEDQVIAYKVMLDVLMSWKSEVTAEILTKVLGPDAMATLYFMPKNAKTSTPSKFRKKPIEDYWRTAQGAGMTLDVQEDKTEMEGEVVLEQNYVEGFFSSDGKFYRGVVSEEGGFNVESTAPLALLDEFMHVVSTTNSGNQDLEHHLFYTRLLSEIDEDKLIVSPAIESQIRAQARKFAKPPAESEAGSSSTPKE